MYYKSNYCNHKWDGYAENISLNSKLIHLVSEIWGYPGTGTTDLAAQFTEPKDSQPSSICLVLFLKIPIAMNGGYGSRAGTLPEHLAGSRLHGSVTSAADE